jgi:putative NADH-flavin reductase
MKITVFGAAGAIGRLIVGLALERGWEVTAVARNAAGLPPEDQRTDKLTVIEAELTDEKAIERSLAGAQAALTAFGPSFGRLPGGVLPLTEGIKTIERAMERLGVKRFIVLATPSAKSAEDEPVFWARFLPRLIRLFIPDAYREITGMGRAAAASNLDWTIVRQILPNNGRARGVSAGFMNRRTRFAVSRADVAQFMVDQVEDKTFIKRMPVIYSKR